MKKVLITGASSGLGIHLSHKFESKGHEVIRHNGKKQFNLTNSNEVVELANMARQQKVNVLINNAAIVCPSLKFESYTDTMIDEMIAVNLRAPIMLCSLLLEQLENIVNINSMVGLEIKSPRTLYSATKWGLRGFSNSLKMENKNISILDVYPTNIKTTPDRQNAMDVHLVVNAIYEAFESKQQELILDGRKQ